MCELTAVRMRHVQMYAHHVAKSDSERRAEAALPRGSTRRV